MVAAPQRAVKKDAVDQFQDGLCPMCRQPVPTFIEHYEGCP